LSDTTDLALVAETVPICGFTPEDVAHAMADLLPVGMIWPRDPESVQQRVIAGLAAEFSRVLRRDCELLDESYPCGATETLPDWERVAGLPDPCTGPLPTLQQRQAALCGRLAGTGGASPEYFIELARSLGFDITITTFDPFRTGLSHAGDPLYGEEWVYAWRVNIAAGSTVTLFRAGRSRAGEPLATWGIRLLECVLSEYAPAHTRLMFSYEGNA